MCGGEGCHVDTTTVVATHLPHPLIYMYMSQQQGQINMVMNNETELGGDTTYTKIFVGGLAWETHRETMRCYFEQFGEILEAVVINEKFTGRSKGYGFVTFKEADAAMRACRNPYPVIDERRANCNLAFLGSSKNRPYNPQGPFGGEKQGPASSPRAMIPSPCFRQPVPQYAFPYSAYGYPAYPQQDIYAMNYYNMQRGQQFTPYNYSPGGVYINYPSSQSNSATNHYQKMIARPPPFMQTQHFPGSFGFISVPHTSSTSPSLAGP